MPRDSTKVPCYFGLMCVIKYILETLSYPLVRPTLDFGSIIRSQNYLYKKDLETVQHKLLKRIAFDNNTPIPFNLYSTTQESIELNSIDLRRQNIYHIFFYIPT